MEDAARRDRRAGQPGPVASGDRPGGATALGDSVITGAVRSEDPASRLGDVFASLLATRAIAIRAPAFARRPA